MAENKKSFIAYVDWRGAFDELPDDKAGQLIKHLFSYVADEDPQTDDILIKAVFANIKAQLKRDLVHWNTVREVRAEGGRASGRARAAKAAAIKGTKGTDVNFPKQKKQKGTKRTVSVNDNDNDSDNVTETETETVILKKNFYKKKLSETKVSQVPKGEEIYFEITLVFWESFKVVIQDGDLTATIPREIKDAKNDWLIHIRRIMQLDGYSKEDLIKVFNFLKTDIFWRRKILSTYALRKHFLKLLMKIKDGKKGTKNNNPTGVSKDYIQGIANDLQS